MLTLGWHGGVKSLDEDVQVGYSSHDAAAVLLVDGELVAAIEEERLSRTKHSNSFPHEAISWCLRHCGVMLADVDVIVTDCAEDTLDQFLVFDALVDPNVKLQTPREHLAQVFTYFYGVDVAAKLRFCGHHLAHLHSAFYPSGFERALCISFDGEGDGLSGMIALAGPSGLEILRELPAHLSFGDFYTKMIAAVGYRRFDEYKVMGLAPYGDPGRYRALFERLYQLRPNGEFEIAADPSKLAALREAGLFSPLRRKNEPFTETHRDFAAALQASLEQLATHVIDHFRAQTGERNLCLSGGVAHNCTLNGKLLERGWFDRMFVQPAAHDAGNALGAALAVSIAAGAPPSRRRLDLYLGTDTGDELEIERALARWSELLVFERDPAVIARAARRLADGAVIGWVSGRSEFGPRALGNRSILADPRPSENRAIVNRMVKKREGYRPFAPAVQVERAREFFVVPETAADLSFMNYVLLVQPAVREQLGAITHVDGTARVQTVCAEQNPRFYALLGAFAELTGVPILLNTSFNNDAEPIVDSVEDAIVCYLTTGLHDLVIGDYYVTKRDFEPGDEAIGRLRPVLLDGHRLVRQSPRINSGPRCTLERPGSSYFGARSFALSERAFELLRDDNGGSIDRRCARLALSRDHEACRDLRAELYQLWERRALRLVPSTTAEVRS
jgi:carbamoyltransferase